MGITLWYSPLPNSNFSTQFNYLVSSLSTLIPNNELNITYNDFKSYNSDAKEQCFNSYGFDILPCHITLMKNIPDDDEIFNKLMKLILAILHTDEERINKYNKYAKIRLQKDNMISFDKGNFFKSCVLEVDKISISILLSMIKIINENIPEIPAVDFDVFQPHISLCYTNNKTISNKEVQNTIEKRMNMYLNLNSCELDWGVGMGSLYKNKKLGRFYLVRCEGPVDTWEVLRSIDV